MLINGHEVYIPKDIRDYLPNQWFGNPQLDYNSAINAVRTSLHGIAPGKYFEHSKDYLQPIELNDRNIHKSKPFESLHSKIGGAVAGHILREQPEGENLEIYEIDKPEIEKNLKDYLPLIKKNK